MSKRKDNYSVFVGHLAQTTTKEDLTRLFSKCGKIVEIFTLNSDDQNYAYGFVRYANKDSALQAVQELDKWQMNGLPMIVDLSRETKVRIQEEGELEGRGTIMSKTPPENPDRNKKRENSRGYIEDVINLSRFQECCNQINTRSIHTGNNQKINADRLLNDISEMGYHAAPNLASELFEYEAVDLHNLTKKLLSHSYGCTDQSLSENDTKEFFLALEVIMDTIQSFTAFCNHGVKPEVLRQAEEVRRNQKIQNEQNVLQNLEPSGNKKESMISRNNDRKERVTGKTGVEMVKEGTTDELKDNQDIRHCNPQTYVNSTVQTTSDLRMKERNLKELLFGGQGSNNINGENIIRHNILTRNGDFVLGQRNQPDIIPVQSYDILTNTDSDSDDCDLNMENSTQNISSLRNISNKTIPKENDSSGKACCMSVPNSGDISSLKQLKDSKSDTEIIRKQNNKLGLLGRAPANMIPGILNGGDGLLGAAPTINQASLRTITTGQLNYATNTTNPGLLGKVPGHSYQTPMENSIASAHSIINSVKPINIDQSNSRNIFSSDHTKSKLAKQNLPLSLNQLSNAPSNNYNFGFGRGRGFHFKP